ncbi:MULTISPECIES: DUF3168 domain-containing protein [unclassified Ruegeria]|uniref:DUF3168 domain-containing protein n=1 Tax=unclassified Ruegeria TaxID=2625375 RepID=UPI001487E15A|nr:MULTISPECIES: DUF3168 domain-containing protein [unclassified Ruegeria]NOD34215.1 DUF3168 domain-containing protein [Ruegeria sp. HKCCD7296]NOE32508.1 DUF3168 domain-containing protein [Ruegeria sp. HKCCD7318]NOE41239.1 DUF3168 domain-containing protein [Ruegeria sp. HKCCD7319]
MSYGVSAALQAAVYQQLLGDIAVSNQSGGAIYDAVPAGVVPQTYVTLGPEEVRDASDRSGAGAIHRFTVSVVSEAAGFGVAKTLAGAVCDALEGAPLTLDRGHLVGLWFERARARRTGTGGTIRQIDLRFRARVEDD